MRRYVLNVGMNSFVFDGENAAEEAALYMDGLAGLPTVERVFGCADDTKYRWTGKTGAGLLSMEPISGLLAEPVDIPDAEPTNDP